MFKFLLLGLFVSISAHADSLYTMLERSPAKILLVSMDNDKTQGISEDLFQSLKKAGFKETVSPNGTVVYEGLKNFEIGRYAGGLYFSTLTLDQKKSLATVVYRSNSGQLTFELQGAMSQALFEVLQRAQADCDSVNEDGGTVCSTDYIACQMAPQQKPLCRFSVTVGIKRLGNLDSFLKREDRAPFEPPRRRPKH